MLYTNAQYLFEERGGEILANLRVHYFNDNVIVDEDRKLDEDDGRHVYLGENNAYVTSNDEDWSRILDRDSIETLEVGVSPDHFETTVVIGLVRGKRILFLESENLNKKDILRVIALASALRSNHVVIQSMKILRKLVRECVSDFDSFFRIEVFRPSWLAGKPFDHGRTAVHRLATKEERKARENDLDRLGTILTTDPVVLFYDFHPGDLIHITRKDHSTGAPIVEARVVR